MSLEIHKYKQIGYFSYISKSASVDHETAMGMGQVRVFDDSQIDHDVTIGDFSLVGSGVRIGPGVKIGSSVLILDDVQVCPNDVMLRSTDARHIGNSSIIGPGVVLDDEVELGSGAIVPTDATLKTIGKFGEKRRTITIYGSQSGPKISLGCNIGSTLKELLPHFASPNDHHSNNTSAETYRPFIDIFQDISRIVQKAFDKENALVDELISAHSELINDFTVPYSIQE
jgi:serine acetyltransferase